MPLNQLGRVQLPVEPEHNARIAHQQACARARLSAMVERTSRHSLEHWVSDQEEAYAPVPL